MLPQLNWHKDARHVTYEDLNCLRSGLHLDVDRT